MPGLLMINMNSFSYDCGLNHYTIFIEVRLFDDETLPHQKDSSEI
jgi:hypothetical protein